jgi:hypothetical protein
MQAILSGRILQRAAVSASYGDHGLCASALPAAAPEGLCRTDEALVSSESDFTQTQCSDVASSWPYHHYRLRCRVLTAVKMTPCGLVDGYKRFGELIAFIFRV